MNRAIVCNQRCRDRAAGTASMILRSGLRVFRWVRVGGIAVVAVAAMAACAPPYQAPQEVATRPPAVSYNYSSDDGLVEANDKARAYCSQYASTPRLQGSISDNADGTKTVTFECVKTAAGTPPPVAVTPSPVPVPPSPPRGYSYRTDTELLQAIGSADAYCARSGQIASSSIVTTADGTKTLTFQCVPRGR
jgi:hypothetical protein